MYAVEASAVNAEIGLGLGLHHTLKIQRHPNPMGMDRNKLTRKGDATPSSRCLCAKAARDSRTPATVNHGRSADGRTSG